MEEAPRLAAVHAAEAAAGSNASRFKERRRLPATLAACPLGAGWARAQLQQCDNSLVERMGTYDTLGAVPPLHGQSLPFGGDHRSYQPPEAA